MVEIEEQEPVSIELYQLTIKKYVKIFNYADGTQKIFLYEVEEDE